MNRKEPLTRVLASRAGRIASVAAALLLAALPGQAVAQAWPSRPLALVVTVPAGGSIDAMARLIAPELGKAIGQTVVVENRAGASGNIAAEYVAKAPADGHTMIILSSSTFTLNPHVFATLPFDPVKDFAPVVMPARLNLLLVVHPKLNVTTVAQFIDLLKSQPGKLNYGSSGAGTTPHLGGEIFALRTGTSANHIPYKGIAPALNDLLSGQTDFMFDSASSVPHVRAGKLRALAVVGPSRLAALPDVATFRELGINDMEVAGGWYGIFMPAATPRDVVTRLNAEAVKILRMPATIERLSAIGLVPASSTPAELGAALRDDLQRLGPIVKAAKITPQ